MNLIISYFFANRYYVITAMYFLLSSILKAFSNIDICIPCVWRLLFKTQCFGCGLTRAFINLLHFDFSKAYDSNWLIFMVVPFILGLMVYDFISFTQKYNNGFSLLQ
jgi:hypothetical protein